MQLATHGPYTFQLPVMKFMRGSTLAVLGSALWRLLHQSRAINQSCNGFMGLRRSAGGFKTRTELVFPRLSKIEQLNAFGWWQRVAAGGSFMLCPEASAAAEPGLRHRHAATGSLARWQRSRTSQATLSHRIESKISDGSG